MTQRPRKVLHVLNSAGGGAALSTLGLMEQFRQMGVTSCAVCHDSGSPHERQCLHEATDGEVRFTPLYWWNKKIRSPLWKRPLSELKQSLATGWTRRSAREVVEQARQCGADLIHTNTLLTPEGGMAAAQLQLPHVWHVRELIGAGNPFPLRLSGPALGKYLVGHCSKLIANSEVCASYVRDLVPSGWLEVVPNGIDITRFVPREVDGSRDRIVVAMVGNLTSRLKKHRLFVEAAARTDPSLPIQWRIYGHDPSDGGSRAVDSYVNQLHARIAAVGLAHRFAWPGFVSDPAKIMSEIDILVHPVDNESFGRTVVEAMAAGLPTVGVAGGGVAEIIEDGVTGLIAATDDSVALAGCIERLARDGALRQTMGAAGRRRAEANYSLEACAAGVMRVYEAAMEHPVTSQSVGPTLPDVVTTGNA